MKQKRWSQERRDWRPQGCRGEVASAVTMDTSLMAPQRQNMVGDRQSVLGCPRDLKQSPWTPPFPRHIHSHTGRKTDSPRQPQRRRDVHTAPHAHPASAVSLSRSSGRSRSPVAPWGQRIQMVVPPQSPRLGGGSPPQAPHRPPPSSPAAPPGRGLQDLRPQPSTSLPPSALP
ncbi:unnamed protein product [Rangifer tarandus platyrhynchus]|uniref:Uncharacterized protein n=1 Tax=Rangifer tarandus platyrhynchus TaxID=3082113 RepID=A0AC59Z6R4_RANTA